MNIRRRQSIVLLVPIGLGACSSPTEPPPPPPDAPSLTCPASVSLVSSDGARVPYPFAIPTPVNGQPPVTVSCSGMQGAGYPAGSTIVTCTATDALSRQASCNFSVTVTVTPKISKAKFLAFGDSITFGRCGPKESVPNTCPPYTVRLEELLRARYTQQNFLMVTRGLPGETSVQGEDRLPDELSIYSPEVLLLMEGTNDLTGDESDPPRALDSLGDMIDFARSRGVVVFLATVPPIGPGGPHGAEIPLVAPFNNQIRDLAAQKGVPLVDVFAALIADVARYYTGGDDLHPTGEGLRLIGETFYAKIRETLDITPTGSSSFMQSFMPAGTPSGLADLITPPRRPAGLKRLPGT